MTEHVTDVLQREHYLFARLLDGLEALLGTRGTPEEQRLAADVLAFFETGVDGLHQEKEERVLLAGLLARPARLRLPAVISSSVRHRRDRRLLAGLRADLVSFGEWNRPAADPFVARARLYVRLQRRHMREENRTLFPLIRSALRPEDEASARAGFRRLEALHGRAFEPEALALLGRLTTQLGEVAASAATEQLCRDLPAELREAL